MNPTSIVLALATLGLGDGPVVNEHDVEVKYHKFIVFRYRGDLVALHMLPDPRYGRRGVTYQWYHVPEQSDSFYGSDDASPEPLANPKLQIGYGEAHERLGNMDRILAGPLTIEWHRDGVDSGRLFFHTLETQKEGLSLYGRYFDRLEDVDELAAENWIEFTVCPDTGFLKTE